MKCFCLLLLLLYNFPAIAFVGRTDPYIDSLKNQIISLEKDNLIDSLLNTRLELIKYVRNSEFEYFLELSNANIELAKKEGKNWAQIDTYMELGDVLNYKGIFSEALLNLNIALRLAEVDEYRPYVGWVSISIGNTYEGMQAYNKAIEFYQKAYSVFYETDNTIGKALASSNIGNCYNILNEFGKAEEFLRQGIKFWEQTDDLVNLAYSRMNLAEIKLTRGDFEGAKNELKSLMENVEKAVPGMDNSFEVNEAKLLLSLILANVAKSEARLGNKTEAVKNLEKAISLDKEINNTIYLATTYNLIGQVFLDEKDFQHALEYADSAMAISHNERIFVEEAKSYLLASNIYTALNKPGKALFYYKQFKSVNDSIYSNAVIQAISDVDAFVLTIEKEKNNQILGMKVEQEKNIRIVSLVAVGLIVIIIGFFSVLVYLRYRTEKKLTENLRIKNQQILEQSKNLELLNEELQVLNKSKDKFHSIIAHDLRNPTATIFSMTSLLNESYDDYDEDTRRELIQLVCEMSDRTVKLLDNLLTWSRVQLGRLAVNYSDFIIDDVLKESIGLSAQIAQAKGITLEFAESVNLTVKADKEMITAVIRNFHSNAIKFSLPGQQIKSGVKRNGDNVEVWIQDEGIGIPKDILEKLFNIDSEIQRKGTNNEAGTGLGLQLCNEFIKMHNGRIYVKSEEGKGSRFSFCLPV